MQARLPRLLNRIIVTGVVSEGVTALPESRYTGVAQLVEHWSPKPGVGSSSLSSRANYKKDEENR